MSRYIKNNILKCPYILNILKRMESRNTLCRVLFWALDKEVFAERQTRQSTTLGNDHVYREQDSRHRKTLDKDSFAECQTLGKGSSTVVYS
jgi:hypothetical protein